MEDLGGSGSSDAGKDLFDDGLRHAHRDDRHGDMRHDRLSAAGTANAQRGAGSIRLGILNAGARLDGHEGVEPGGIHRENAENDEENEMPHLLSIYHARAESTLGSEISRRKHTRRIVSPGMLLSWRG